MSGHGEKLTRRMHQAVAALLDCPTVEKAAEQVGVADSTLRRWLQRDDFRVELDRAGRELVAAAVRRKGIIATEATDVLVRSLRGELPTRTGRLAVMALRYAVGVNVSIDTDAFVRCLVALPEEDEDTEKWAARYSALTGDGSNGHGRP